jgi:hypothetical protein
VTKKPSSHVPAGVFAWRGVCHDVRHRHDACHVRRHRFSKSVPLHDHTRKESLLTQGLCKSKATIKHSATYMVAFAVKKRLLNSEFIHTTI